MHDQHGNFSSAFLVWKLELFSEQSGNTMQKTDAYCESCHGGTSPAFLQIGKANPCAIRIIAVGAKRQSQVL